MTSWEQFAKTHHEGVTTTGTKPSPLEYVVIAATENALSIVVIVFTLLFAIVGLFMFSPTDREKMNWALHAAELCLGVLLGLLKTRRR